LLVSVTDPVALPTPDGANVMVSVAVCDGFKVAGVVKPLTEYPAPLAATAEIVTAAVPVLLITTDWPVLLPVATAPKPTLDGLAVRCPVAAADPVPVNGTLSVGLVGSLLVIVMLPVAAPAAVGANVTATWADCPALIVFGVVNPLIVNAEPVTAIADTVRSADPVLLRDKFVLVVCPVETVPNPIEVGETDNCG